MPSIIPGLTDVENVCDHGVDQTKFSVMLQPDSPGSSHVTISPEQLMMSCGVQDGDHLRIHKAVITGAHLPAGQAASAVGVVLSAGSTPLSTASRVTHIDSELNSADCVHCVAKSTPLTHPVAIEVGPCRRTINQVEHEAIARGVARVARWSSVTPEQAKVSSDVTTFEKGGQKRHLFPASTSASSSPVVRLFEHNIDNPSFMEGRYLRQNRTAVGSDNYLVNNPDFEAAQNTLEESLKPRSMFATEGLKIQTINLGGGGEVGPCHVDFTLHRTPLTTSDLTDGINSTALDTHMGMLTVGSAQQALGESATTLPTLVAVGGGPSVEAVFAPVLRNA